MESVYILKANNKHNIESVDGKQEYKIGRSIHIDTRIKQFKTGSHCPNILIQKYLFDDSSKLEAYIHNYLQQHNTEGEWFELTLEELKDAQNKIQNYINLHKNLNDIQKDLNNVQKDIKNVKNEVVNKNKNIIINKKIDNDDEIMKKKYNRCN